MTNLPNSRVIPLTPERSVMLVRQANLNLKSLKDGEDAFLSFAQLGFSTRLEALHAIYIAIADCYREKFTYGPKAFLSRGEFEDYANRQRKLAIRVMCDGISDPNWRSDTASRFQSTIGKTTNYFASLNPHSLDYWLKVYRRIGLDCPYALVKDFRKAKVKIKK